jgi:circadian clock protein KaiC
MLRKAINKTSTGVKGLDEVTGGGLPAGRTTLVCGGPGAGKTLLATTFLMEGANHHEEPGVFISFDEGVTDLEANTLSLGFDLVKLQDQGRLVIDHILLDRNEIYETGEYNLEGLFIRLDAAIQRVAARRVVLDSIDTLFAGIPNEAILRAELRRLFAWLKDRNLTTVITTEQGETTLTRQGIEEYVSDCVILLDQRIQDELSTRRLRIVKYRGSSHGTNEYPFLIEETGLSLLPLTSLGLGHTVSNIRVSSGISGLDDMLEGKGYYQGSSIMVTGGPGTGKTSIAASFVMAALRRGETCLYYAFEESEPQLLRNMATIGIDLSQASKKGLLTVKAMRPTSQSLETLLARIMHDVRETKPNVIVLDPLTALEGGGSTPQTSIMVLRTIDFLKTVGVTALYLHIAGADDQTDLNVSSLMDTWITIRNVRHDNGRERQLYIVKSRGMAHSTNVNILTIASDGVTIRDRT